MKIFSTILVLLLSGHLQADILSKGLVKAKWSKRNIVVCWLDNSPPKYGEISQKHLERWAKLPPFSTVPGKLKHAIQTLIQTQFTEARTGVYFTGWKSCKETSDYDAVIASSQDRLFMAGEASIGQSKYVYLRDLIEPLYPGEKGWIYFTRSNAKETITTSEEASLLTVIHEFGHLAGLVHEDQENIFATRFSEADPSSVMSYEYLDFLQFTSRFLFYVQKFGDNRKITNKTGKAIVSEKSVTEYVDPSVFKIKAGPSGLLQYQVTLGLSQGDVHSLKCMYIYDKMTFRDICHVGHKLR